MKDLLSILLKIAGAGLISLALIHIPVVRHLKWHEEYPRMSPPNASIFKVHAFFICLVLVMMGLPCLLDPAVFLEKTRAGAWLSWSIAGFWALRLYFQWFVYQRELWRGKPLETRLHWLFTFVWIAFAGVFTCCGLIQAGFLR